MARPRSHYVCQSCGAVTARWSGRCEACGAWNSIAEEAVPDGTPGGLAKAGSRRPGRRVEFVGLRGESASAARLVSGIGEFDRVCGGGLVPGSAVLVGGDPGIGKSTLVLQTAAVLAGEIGSALYVSAEESAQQIKLRADRLGLSGDNLWVLSETNLSELIAAAGKQRPGLLIVDSIQTVYLDEITSAAGSVSQVRECTSRLMQWAKPRAIPVVIVGHVTKEGTIAGPRVLEHMVDTVLYFENDAGSRYRVIRAVKNRFGAVNELGVFAMTDRGLRGVANPSALFLSQHEQQVAGSCVMATQEGTRPLLVEIQALVDSSHAPNPRRLTVGLEGNRLAMLLAVLHRHAGVSTFDQDVFVNAVGGVKIDEPAADLAVLLAIVSSLKNVPLPGKLVAFGEVGLAGEVRPVQRGQERLREAAKLGFSHALIPHANRPRHAIAGLEIVAVRRVEEAVTRMRELVRAEKP